MKAGTTPGSSRLDCVCLKHSAGLSEALEEAFEKAGKYENFQRTQRIDLD